MDLLRKFLLPVSAIYGLVVKLRNFLYDKGLFKSKTFKTPVIVVGNLSVGGTGKTPMVEYLCRLLAPTYNIAILSRGYKRKTKGFVLAGKDTKVMDIGDEPMQYHSKFKNVSIAVDEDRARGIDRLLNLAKKPDLILLDDGFQHRRVKAGLNILLTSFDNLYVNDHLLPSGNLREGIQEAKRAQIIIVTKCPDSLDEKAQFRLAQKLKIELTQTVYFSKIRYSESIYNKSSQIKLEALNEHHLLLVTGVAKPQPLLIFLDSKGIKYDHKRYKDHHLFTEGEVKNIIASLDEIKNKKKLILTTEKDYIRLADKIDNRFYYLPIESTFLMHGKDFDKQILNYVG